MKRLTHRFLLCLFLALAVTAGHADLSAAKSAAYVGCDPRQQLICQVSDSAYIDQLTARYPITVIDYLHEVYSYLLCVEPGYDADSIAALCEADPKVNYCTENFEFDLPEVVQGSQPFVDRPGDNNQFVAQPGAPNLKVAQIDSLPFGAPVRIGVIDVGVDLHHPLLQGVLEPGYDFLAGDSVPQDEPGGTASGHGTFIAGLIHRLVPQAEIRPYRVLDTGGRGSGWLVAEAMIQAMRDSCKVINLSLVMQEKHECVDNAIEFARSKNVMIVAAAGNDSSSAFRFPASDSYVLCVTAVDSADHKASFANYGGHVDVCAPGVHLYAPFPDSAYADWNGTSFAAPVVTAQAALLYSLKPSAKWNDIFDAIRHTATNVDAKNPSLPNGSLGFGLVNFKASVAALGLTCGDVDASGSTPDVGDLTLLMDNLFISFAPLPEPEVANVDGIPGIDIGDLTVLIDHLFISLTPLNCGF